MKPRTALREVPRSTPDPIGEIVDVILAVPTPVKPRIDRSEHRPKVCPFASSDPFKSDNAGLFMDCLRLHMAGAGR